MTTNNQPISDTFVITKSFSTPEEFSIHIEKEAMTLGMSLIDTILMYCEEHDIDSDVIAKLISRSLKEKIRSEAEYLHMIKPEDNGTLPL